MPITITPGNGNATITISDDVVSLDVGTGGVTLSLPTDGSTTQSYLLALGTYNSDLLASAGGVPVGGHYWTGPAHEVYPEGALIKRTI